MLPPRARRLFRLVLRGDATRRAERRLAEVDEEIRLHLELRVEQLVARGVPPEEARRRALAKFGPLAEARVRLDAANRDREDRVHLRERFDALAQDARLALRGLRRAPGFALAVLLTLAVGIGSAAAIFSVAYGVLLRPLPFREPERLVKLGTSFPAIGIAGEHLATFEYDALAERRSFAGLAALREVDRTLGGDDRPERVVLAPATASLFSVLGVQPRLGRVYTADEDRPGGPALIVLGHGLWTRRFGADPAILGRTVRVDGVEHTVIGVLPAGVRLGAAEAFFPLRIDRSDTRGRMDHWLMVVGRLRPGVTDAQLRDDLGAYARQLRSETPDFARARFELTVRPLRDALFGDARPTMVALLGTVVLLLLLASVNVANLLLVRAEARQRELGVRAALGASRGRLVRQLLTESLVLAVAGAAIGVPLAALGVRALLAINPDVVPPGAELSLDAGVLAAVAGIVALAALVAGAAPALHAGDTDVRAVIASGSAGGGRRGSRLRSAFVVAEVALAAVMLVGAGLVGRSFQKLVAVDPGFDPRGALVMDVALPRTRYDAPHEVLAFYDRALDGLRALPGVSAVAGISHLPLGGEGSSQVLQAEERPANAPPPPAADITIASRDVFAALGIAVREGRAFGPDDRPDAPPAMVVNEALATAFWPGESAIGKRVRFPGPDRPWFTVVGVVADVHGAALHEAPRPTFYALDEQLPGVVGRAEGVMTLVARTAGDPASLAAAARRVVSDVDPELAVANVRTLDAVVARSVSRPRFAVAVLGAFGASALLLAVIGVYGVLSFAVTRRRREVAVRLALGAKEHEVRRLVVGAGLRLAAMGVVAGLGAALALGRVLQALLFEVSPTDAATLVGVGATLLAAAVAASWLPARRATTVSPAEVLREQ